MNIKKLKKGYKRLTASKARVIGHLIGDGCVCISGSDYHIRYEVKDLESINSFKEDLVDSYGLIPSEGFNISPLSSNPIPFCHLRSKMACIDLFHYTRSYKSGEWFLTSKIIDAPSYIKKEFLRALFDDEGTYFITKHGPLIRLYSINFKGILQIKEILERDFNISSKIYEGYGKNRNVYGLVIKDVLKFNKRVGFNLKRKSFSNLS